MPLPHGKINLRTADDRWELVPRDGLDAQLCLEVIGCTMPLAEVYERIVFPPERRNNKPPAGLCTKSRSLAVFLWAKWVYLISKNRQNETKKSLLTCASDF